MSAILFLDPDRVLHPIGADAGRFCRTRYEGLEDSVCITRTRSSATPIHSTGWFHPGNAVSLKKKSRDTQ